MLASAAYSRAGLSARRKIHARYAELVDDIEDRARHLSLATDEPDAEVAAVLERAAVSARARGAPGAAADLAEQALRLTPAGQVEDVGRRRIDAGGYWFDAGDAVRARTHLEQAAETVGSGAVRADVLTRLARTYAFGADMRVAARLYRQALAEAEAEDRVRAQAEAGLAVALMRMLDDLPTATSHASAATKIAEKLGDRWLLADFLSVQALTEGLVGDARASEHMSLALQLATEEAPDAPAGYFLRGLQGPTFMDGILKIWNDDLEDARLKLTAARERALELGDESSLPLILRWASYAEWLVGDWPRALRLAEHGEELALQTGQPSQQAVLTATRGLVLAHVGRSEAALEAAEEGLRLADQTGSGFGRMVATAAIGLLELSRGNALAVYEHLAPLAEKLESARVIEPGAVRFVSDLIEALILLGRLPEAELLLERQEQRARSFDRASALAAGGRCRGLLHAAQGDFPQAIATFEGALGEHDRARSPFELARTLLGLGAAQRRSKQKRAARASLEQALTIFGDLDAALWAEKAKAELARVGGRTPSGDTLTPTERQLAELVAEGRSNKAAAAALSLTTKTVETKLSRIYAKLGVRSRTELAHLLAQEKATKL